MARQQRNDISTVFIAAQNRRVRHLAFHPRRHGSNGDARRPNIDQRLTVEKMGVGPMGQRDAAFAASVQNAKLPLRLQALGQPAAQLHAPVCKGDKADFHCSVPWRKPVVKAGS